MKKEEMEKTLKLCRKTALDLSFARVLDWGRGHRFGVVLGQKREDSWVMAYVRALQQLLPSLSEKLFGLKLEPVEG